MIAPMMAAQPNPPLGQDDPWAGDDPDDGFDDEDVDLAPKLESVAPSEAFL